jgi:succinate-acetate transporter protein
VRHGDDLGTFRRLLLALFGLMLAGNLTDNKGLSWIVGAFGVVVFLGAVGVIELAMALWYRSQRRHSRL